MEYSNNYNPVDVNIELAAEHFHTFLECLGISLEGEHLKNTPKRTAKAYHEWFSQHARPFEFTIFNAHEQKEMIVVSNISFYSLCAHHILPFWGIAHVGYIPNDYLVGISKLARTVDKFAHQPTVQEDLTSAVADYINDHLDPSGVGVILEAEHMCMTLRGVQKPGHKTITSALRGSFHANPETRAEFLSLTLNRR